MPDENVPASAIDVAPDETSEGDTRLVLGSSHVTTEMVLEAYNRLQTQNEALTAELNRVTGSSEAARAQLIKPYAWAVLFFLCAYGGVVGLLLFLQGFSVLGFHLNDGVMGVLVSSTAVAAIGLVHTVVKGLFPPPKE